MSKIYISEPPTNGKVVLRTSMGDIEIELWGKEAPLAVRNFIQLALEGQYNGIDFHRIVRGFIIQTGDPSGTGRGGCSIYGRPFKDEFHSRLRFSRRGIVAMANDGTADNNQSQFFITLDKADHLNHVHTIFGKVVGDTIFNVLRIGEVETDEDERPVYSPKLLRVDVLNNPFDDIISREQPKKSSVAATVIPKSSTAKAVRNRSLLSFGDEDDSGDTLAGHEIKLKPKSAHDLLKDDPRLHDSRIIETSAVQPPAIVGNVKLESIEKEIAKARINTLQTTGGLPVGSDSSAIPPKSTKSQIVELENEIRRSSRDQSVGIESPRHSPKKRQRQSILAQENAKFFKTTLTGKKRNTEEATLAKLVAFQQKLRQNSTDEAVISEEDYEKPPCALHNVPGCASCTASVKSLSDDNAAIPADWMKHELKFEKDLSGKNLLDPATRRIDNVADLEVIDPRSRQQLGSGKLVAKAASREWNRK